MMNPVFIEIPKGFKSMTGRQFIEEIEICDEGKAWMKKIGLKHRLPFYWNRCSRYGWLDYIRWKLNYEQYDDVDPLRYAGLILDAGTIISKKKADHYRSIVKIKWI